MPYLLQGQLTIGLGATMTMQPGVIVKLAGGSIFVQRAFLAEGRTDSLVVFTSYRDDSYGGDTNNDSTYTSPAWQFEQRFASFRSVPNPPVLTYDDFERTLSSGREGLNQAHTQGEKY